MAEEALDPAVVTQVQQMMWSQGDFARIGVRSQAHAERLCEAARVIAGERVLDVACGQGNVALAAARRFAEVTGVDYVPELLEKARERAAVDWLEAEFVEGDAQDLPFEDASFDVVLSMYGVMFAPDHAKAAAELLRVCRSGGRIVLACWTPDGLPFFEVLTRHAAPPPGVPDPTTWGTEEHARELFGDGITDLRAKERTFEFHYRSAEHWLEYFRAYFGPMAMAFARVGDDGAGALEADLLELMRGRNIAGDRALLVPASYLELVATRA